MINRISNADLEKKITFFLQNKIKFKMYSTTERTVIHAEGRWGSWMNKESSFKPSELQFIKAVKQYVIKHGTYKKVRNNFRAENSTKKIKYFYYNPKIKPGDYFENCIEIDLKNAYWDTSYNLPKDGTKLFSKELYEKGLTVSKKSRLAAIGSLAKTVSVLEFDGVEQHKLPDEPSKITEFLWHTICHKTGKLMAKASKTAKDDFMFFWVDAIFIKGKAAKEIIKLFKKAGYESSIFKCEWVRFEDKRIVVKSTQKGKWVTETKEEIIERDGRKFRKKIKVKVWRDERPFPYKTSLTEKEVTALAAAAE